jgi:hypothetical protein
MRRDRLLLAEAAQDDIPPLLHDLRWVAEQLATSGE